MPRDMNMRRWLLLLLVASFIWLVISRADEVEHLAETLASGVWQWVVVAALLQVAYFVTQARVFQVCLQLVGVRSKLSGLVPVFLGSMFINTVAPSGGTAGVALYVDDAIQRGQSGARATAGTVLGIVGGYAGFGLILIFGLVYLWLQDSIRIYEIIAALALLLFTLALTSLLALGATRPQALFRVLAAFQRLVNGAVRRLGRAAPLAEDWSEATGSEFAAAAEVARNKPLGLLQIVAWAVLSYLINAASLYAVFLAFGERAPAAVVVATFAVGHLFVIIAPSPQGVGFVETILPVTMAGLGISSAVATISVLAYRGLAFWLPMLVGFFMLQRLRSLGGKEQTIRELWSVRIVAILTALLGLVNIVSATYPALAQDLQPVTQYAPLQLRRGGQVGALVTGLILVVLAHALWRRKRAAWVISLLVLLLSGISLALNYALLDIRTLLTAALLAWLLRLRPHFHARSDPPSMREGAVIFLAALAFLLLYGSAGIYVLALRSGEAHDLQAVLAATAQTLFALKPPAWLLALESGRFLVLSIYATGVLTLLYAFFLLTRPVLLPRPATEAERTRARALLTTFGRNAISRLALLPNAAYYFSEGGSMVAYVLAGRTAVALGDPIGPEGDVLETIRGFAAHCRYNDWLPAFYQATERYLQQYELAGFDAMAVGREAVVDVSEFDARADGTNAFREVTHLLERGYRASFSMPPHNQGLVDELQLINDEWLTVVQEGTQGLLLSHFDETHAAQSAVIMTKTPRSLISAYATLIMDPSGETLAMDVLRHRPQIREGTLELLIVALLQWARRHQFNTVSLGAAFSDMEANGLLNWPTPELLEDEVVEHSERLETVRSRFHPRWLPRYLVYPGATSLPTVWTAVARKRSRGNWLWQLVTGRSSL